MTFPQGQTPLMVPSYLPTLCKSKYPNALVNQKSKSAAQQPPAPRNPTLSSEGTTVLNQDTTHRRNYSNRYPTSITKLRVIVLWYCSGLNYSQKLSPISKHTWRLLTSPCFLYRLQARVNPLVAASITDRRPLIKLFAARTLLSMLQASGFINQAGALDIRPTAKKNGANSIAKWTL